MINTPYYSYDPSILLERIRLFQSFGELYFPVKANAHPELIKYLYNNGSNFEIDSLEHLTMMVNLKIPSQRILFGYPARNEFESNAAIESGVTCFVSDSFEDCKFLLSKREVDTIIIRLAPSSLCASLNGRYLSRWGVSTDEAKIIIRSIKQTRHIRMGVSFYLPEAFYSSATFREALFTIEESLSHEPVSIIDMGGGLTDAETPEFRNELTSFKRKMQSHEIWVEPGRQLLDPCFELNLSVKSVRNRNGNLWVILDAGIYSGLLDVKLRKRHFNVAFDSGDAAVNVCPAILCGPTSDCDDVIGEYKVPCNLKEGDNIKILACGAYSPMLITNFNKSVNYPLQQST